MFEFAIELPLASDKNTSYFGITHDGHQTYLSSGDRQMFLFNDCCCHMTQVDTHCSYHTICYDCTQKCFWAASSDRPGILFCLSKELNELEPIHLSSQDLDPIHIDHLFYDGSGKRLCFTIKNRVYTTDQTGYLKKLSEIKADIEKLEGVCAYHRYLLCLSNRKGERYLSIHTISDGTLLEEYGIPVPFKVSSMTFIQDSFNPLSLRLRLLAVKQEDTPFLIDYQPDLGFFTQYSADYLTDGNSSASASDIQMQQLCRNRIPYPSYQTGCRNCQSGSNCCQSYSDVIESIALTEASIAHILNAEGEKLQKAIACSRNISELLSVNESVLKTITHSTHLEQVLYCKLESILNAGCLECHAPTSPCCRRQSMRDECSDSNCEL